MEMRNKMRKTTKVMLRIKQIIRCRSTLIYMLGNVVTHDILV